MSLSDADQTENFVRLGAMALLVGFAEGYIAEGPEGDKSKVALIGVEAEAEAGSLANIGADYKLRLTMDYVVTIHVETEIGIGIKTTKPMKIRYKRIGVEYDDTRPGEWYEKFDLLFDGSDIEIEDSGVWQVNGALGKLLRISDVVFGRGSFWVEMNVAIAMDSGIIDISEAIFRLTWTDGSTIPKFQLKGFVLNADIPATLKGEGRLRIEDSGMIRAGVDVDVIPVGIKANAAFAMQKLPDYTFLSLAVGIEFSTAIPMAPFPIGIKGLKGMFVMNGTRDIVSGGDPIGGELDWWAKDPEDKYKPQKLSLIHI